MAQELVYETYIKILGYLSLIHSETIIWVLFFICLQQLIEVGAFASISTVFLRLVALGAESNSLLFADRSFGQKGGDFFSRGVWIWNEEIANELSLLLS